MYIIDSRGEKEEFSEEKLYNSIRRVAGDDVIAKEVFDSLKRQIREGARTYDIFKKIKKELAKRDGAMAAKFSIKEGMRKLGPTGFPFEKFIGEIYKNLGFDVKLNQHIPGHCIKDYEIDVIAEKDGQIYVGECKYRNLAGDMVHQNVALSNYARFQDIIKGGYFDTNKFKLKTLLITNTKFTHNAYNYSSCMGVDLLGWKTPRGRGLEFIIDEHKLYPVTLLRSVKGYLRDILVSQKIMLVSEVAKINPEDFSKEFRAPLRSVINIVNEAKSICELGK